MTLLAASPFFLFIIVAFFVMFQQFLKDLYESIAAPCKFFLLKRLVVHSAIVECKKATKEKTDARRH